MRKESVYKLSSEDEKILEFRDKDGMTFSDIGNKLGISSARACDRYRRLKMLSEELDMIKKYQNMDPNQVDDSEFRNFAFAHLSTLTFNALARRGVLKSKEQFMNMSQIDIMRIRNVGTEGFLEIKKLRNILSNTPDDGYEFNFKDEDIDPEMLDIVKNFNRAGIETMFCCQGHFNESNDGGGMSLPYLNTKLPDDGNMLIKILRMHKYYPMININISHSLVYTKELEEFTTCDKYIDIINDNLNECKNSVLEFRVNPIFYNLAEDLYGNNEAYEKIFEYLRKKFISELQKMSEILLKDSNKKEIMKKYQLY